MDDDFPFEMRVGLADEASDRVRTIVALHRDAIDEALEGRVDPGIIGRLHDEIADGLRLRCADRPDEGKQRLAHNVLRPRTRANDRGYREHRSSSSRT